MSMPKFSDYQDLGAYGKAYDEWMASDEGKAKAAEDERKRKEAEEFDRAKSKSSMASAQIRFSQSLGIPRRALDVAISRIERTEAIEASDGAMDLLVLSGGPGCGKTVAAAAWILAYTLEDNNWDIQSSRLKRTPPVWITAAKLARWERYDDEEMQKLLKTPRLVIDDLGGEYLDKGGFYASLLDEIVNERQAESKPTIMTTNLNAEAFKERYGERIVDRIREGGRFIGCGDQSLRHKATP